jgi:hypothetical protein
MYTVHCWWILSRNGEKLTQIYKIYLMNKQPFVRHTPQCSLLYALQENFVGYLDDGRL